MYIAIAISHVKQEVNAGRYSTDNVKDWLIDEGFQDVSLEEATNL